MNPADSICELEKELHESSPSLLAISRRAARAEGQPISELMSRALQNPQLISLAAGFVDQQSLPAESTAKAVESLFADPDAARAALQYGTTPGFPPLRQALLSRMLQQDQMTAAEAKLSLEQIVITPGSNQFLHLLADTLLDPGDIVLCAAPTYLVFLGLLENIGAKAVGVETDADGMIPEALQQTLSRFDRHGVLDKVKAIYYVPYFDNPSGISTPLARRAEIIALAKRWSRRNKIHVIEDAAYRELRYQGADMPSGRKVDEEADTVVVAGTFSKSFSPGIRVGWGVLPAHLVETYCNQKGNLDFGSPNFVQHLMARVLNEGHYQPHIEKIRRQYQSKLQAMLDACDEYFSPLEGVTWERPLGGLYVWAKTPPHLDTGPSGPLFDLAVAEGVLYVPGQYCFPSEGAPRLKNCMRLSFGVQSPQSIRLGMEKLACAIKHAQR